MSLLTKDEIARAAHTLWQAAIASGGVTTAVTAYAHGNTLGEKQGLIVAGTAVGAAVLSLAKSGAVKAVAGVNRWLKSRHVPLDLNYDGVTATAAVVLADVQSGDSVKQVAVDAAGAALQSVHVDPYAASPTP